MRKFDLKKWERKKQYDFFMGYEDPVFGVVAEVDITHLFHFSKENKLSFFLGSLYCSNLAANQVENFRLRLKDGELVVFDQVQLGSTILKEDKSFTFTYMEMKNDLFEFCSESQKRVDQQLKSEVFDPRQDQLDIIYYSILPWIRFSSIKHPSRKDPTFSIPQIVFGKYFVQDKRIFMPVGVEVHHALMDGYHVGQYFERFQSVMDKL
jgi:chloramphenicol O-acetyltransferase type A